MQELRHGSFHENTGSLRPTNPAFRESGRYIRSFNSFYFPLRFQIFDATVCRHLYRRFPGE
jgi:hypothetical protein